MAMMSKLYYLASIALVCIQSNAFSPFSPQLHRVILHYANEPIDTSTGKCFEDLGLSHDLIGVTEKMGWTNPTAVQQLSVPSILEMADSTTDSNSFWCEVCNAT